jgi:NAD(P)H-hydrate epimerase
MAALRSGAGLVTLGIAEPLNPVLEALTLEVMTEPLPAAVPGILGEDAYPAIAALLTGKRCLAIGPGLGQAEDTQRLLLRLIAASEVPVVIDADGINSLAGHLDVLKQCRAPLILTPHPGEMARLAGVTTAVVQNDRAAQARAFAGRNGVHLVLKGANTVIAHPDGTVFINTTGNAGMASGGMGDVLTGMIAGLLTQGFSPEGAAHAGVYLHGAAADTLAQSVGPFGYLASEVMHRIPSEIQRLKNAGNGHIFS